MRILHLLSQTELTGAEVYAQNLIYSQVQSHHQVHVISDRIHVEMPVPLVSMPISTSRRIQKYRNIWALRNFLIENKIEVIHCHSRGAVRHASWARRGLPVALVTTLHGRQHFSWSKRFLDLYGEIRIAICENVKKAMELDFQSTASSIRVLRNPVTLNSSPSTPRIPHSTVQRIALLGRSSGPKGRRFEQIGFRCFESWLRLNDFLEISIIAPHPENFSPEFRNLISKLQAQFPNRIQLQGAIPRLREHLKDFDLALCSGRIAVECLLEKVPVFAIGEHSAPGLMTTENFAECLASNFGDIGAKELEVPLDVAAIGEKIQAFIRNPRPSDQDLDVLKEKVSQEFNPHRIQNEILEIYRAALFKRNVPKWIPILMYHKIPLEDLKSRHRIFVTADRFREHLQFFRKQNFQTLTFRDVKEFWMGRRSYAEFPRKPLILTFDDGYVDNLTQAQPLLKEFGFQGVIFLLGNHQILENTWDADTGEKPDPLMSLEQKKHLDPTVWEIGSHGFDHLHLTQVPEEAALKEMKNSRRQLEKDFQTEILCFAYPFGSTNERLASLAQDAGYSFAVNTDQGGLHLADQPFSLFRVNIFPEDRAPQLWKKTSPWYRHRFYRKRRR